MLARLACLFALVFLPGTARAQEPWTPPAACTAKDWKEVETFRDWIGHTRPNNDLDWAEERSRWLDNPNVWRWLDRLYLAVDGGRVVTLTDCPFTDSTYRYLYEKYDETGGFHIVAVHLYEDLIYALVMKKTGRIFTIPGLPVWSPDRTRFAHGVCSVLNDQDEIAISRVSPDGLRNEAEARMPCGLGDCEIAWESADTVAATCAKAGEQGNEHKVMRLTRRGGSWTATTSDR
jgi:hypothetical protein